MAGPKSEAEAHEAAAAGADSVRFSAGRYLFEQVCGVCHGRDGAGLEGVAPSLVGSPWVTGPKSRLIRIILDGKEDEQLMPPVHDLSDEEIADVLTFVRRAWGDGASPVSTDEVDMVREITQERDMPWTEEELLDIR